MVIAINYANDRFKKSQRYNTITAIKKGEVDVVIQYSPNDIDKAFSEKNIHILNQPKGAGYYVWKPYIICKTLEKMNDGDYLMYCDSGSSYCNKVQYLIDELEKTNQDIMPFYIDALEKHWTKRDAFILMGCDDHDYYNTNQICTGYILVRKTSFSVQFFLEFLNYAQDERIITNMPSVLGENFDGFVENRHDQSIFSLLCKKHKITSFRVPNQYGDKWKDSKIQNIEAGIIGEYPRIFQCFHNEQPWLRRIILIVGSIKPGRYFLRFAYGMWTKIRTSYINRVRSGYKWGK